MSSGADMLDEVAGKIREHHVRLVRMMVADLHGTARAKQVSADYFLEIARTGHTWATPLLAVDLIQDFAEDTEIGLDNLPLIPDLSTFAPLPWRPGTAHVICDVDLGDEVATPRAALRRVESQVREHGFEASLGNEVEFYVYDPARAEFGSGIDIRDWYSDQALGIMAPLLEALNAHLPQIGVPVYEIFNEHGAGQFEFNLRPGGALASADRVFVAKAAIKEMARQAGLRATFMSKPDNGPGIVTSGFHVHQALVDSGGANAFDVGRADGVSDVALNYVAGQLAHAGSLTAFGDQTVTSYKRFAPGTWAPLTSDWSIHDRGTMIRAIPAGANTRFENRLGASDANPYLIAASQLAAGMIGVRDRLVPRPPVELGTTPGGPALPTNLIEAVQALESDTVLAEAMGSRLVGYYSAMLRNEYRRFQRHVTDWEISEYREVN